MSLHEEQDLSVIGVSHFWKVQIYARVIRIDRLSIPLFPLSGSELWENYFWLQCEPFILSTYQNRSV
jgi:hypothetical protein